MNKRSFMDRMGLSSLSLTAALMRVHKNAEAKTLHPDYFRKEKSFRFPQDLEKYAGSPQMLKNRMIKLWSVILFPIIILRLCTTNESTEILYHCLLE